VPDIPKTINGKIIEKTITNLVHGRPVVSERHFGESRGVVFFENISDVGWLKYREIK